MSSTAGCRREQIKCGIRPANPLVNAIIWIRRIAKKRCFNVWYAGNEAMLIRSHSRENARLERRNASSQDEMIRTATVPGQTLERDSALQPDRHVNQRAKLRLANSQNQSR